MSNRREHSTHTTGAHRAHPVRRPTPAPRPERYEACLDGLFTYCLSVMCEHDSATAALGEALAVAERQHARGRAPADRGMHRPWLYALARWACLRRLAQQSRAGRKPAVPHQVSGAAATQRRRELAALAWPEAAGTTPEQREALELSVRHGLPTREVAAALSLTREAAGDLLTSAACEVERTRAALAVVESGGCPLVGRLSGDDRLLMGSGLRRELVRHVDECAECRRAAERAMADLGWPGTAPTGPGALALLEAPRPAVHAAVRAAQRARCQHSPRFGRNGFPAEVKDRAARRERLRSRAVTTTVVATVIAAPVLALWAAYRGAPLTGEGRSTSPVSSTERDAPEAAGEPVYQNVGRVEPGPGRHSKGGSASRVDVRVEGGDGSSSRSPSALRRSLTVEAAPTGSGTLITLTATGDATVRWSASTGADWLVLSRSAGVLEPGESVSVVVSVVEAREPAGAWSARIGIGPVGAVVTLEGRGSSGQQPGGGPQDPGGGTEQPPTSAEPTPSPDPEPDPEPSEEPEPSPDPSATGDASPTPDPEPTPSASQSEPGTGGS
ncbi:RNA polymerase sigma factor [Streptomyces sp. TR06-5]|uniref:RNA polymerase sigma factor n=1 Tax=unclassified Streptomyces TaxID=2593676 RepID=UPI0039A033A0